MIPETIRKQLAKRKSNGTYRFLPAYPTDFTDFHSNDYLGLARRPFSYSSKTLVGATGSRLISGNSAAILDFERFCSEYYSAETVLFFNSGYAANQGVLSSLPQRGDLILYDELIHASLRDGIRLSLAKNQSFPHNQLAKLEKILESKKDQYTETYLVTERLFSMDGDAPDMQKLYALCRKYSCHLILDEAHSTGIIHDKTEDIKWTAMASLIKIHTFGKAMGSVGGLVLAQQEIIDFLINYGRTFVYTTALPDFNLRHLKENHLCLQKEPKRLTQLTENIQYFIQQIKDKDLVNYFPLNNSPIFVFKEDVLLLKMIEKDLLQNQISCKTIVSPTVKKGEERLRICIHNFNTRDEMDELIDILLKHVS